MTSDRKAVLRPKGMVKRRLPLLALLILCLAIFAVSAYMLISHYVQGNREESAFQELAEVVAAEESPTADSDGARPAATGEPEAGTNVFSGYQKLHEQNSDMVGWIKIDGTAIDYPVMYTPDDGDYYLTRGFDKQKAKSGVPFIDQRCVLEPPGSNTIIYGHHMKNGTMFAGLEQYKDEEFFKEHPTIRFDTLHKRQEYEIIAVFESRIYAPNEKVFKHYNFINANSQADFDEYMQNINALSLYETGVNASYGDELVTLITCDYKVEDGQMVVVAVKKS